MNLCKGKGIQLFGGNVIFMKNKGDVDQAFEYAKTVEIEMIIGVPNHELLGYVENTVKQYDIKLAIHNQGPVDKLYLSEESAYSRMKIWIQEWGLLYLSVQSWVL